MEQTEKQIATLEDVEKLFGTLDRDSLQKIASNLSHNPRNAGRKPKFTIAQACQMIQQRRDGKTMTEIARAFGTSRPTVQKYMDAVEVFPSDSQANLKVLFFHDDTLCSVVYADDFKKQVTVENMIDFPLFRAFGVNTNPSWEDFEYFLEDRCFPRERAYASEILKSLGLSYYEPEDILYKTGGHMAEDRQWLLCIRRPRRFVCEKI